MALSTRAWGKAQIADAMTHRSLHYKEPYGGWGNVSPAAFYTLAQ
jgi:hypothetical protein